MFKHVSDPPKARLMDVKLTKLVYPHKSDPPIDDARKVALIVIRAKVYLLLVHPFVFVVAVVIR